MGENVKKDDVVALMNIDPALKKLIVAAGWSFDAYDGKEPLDLDISAFLLGKDDLTRVDEDFVFYNNPKGAEGAILHTMDNRTGAGEGDNETIVVDLNGIPFDVARIVFAVTIHDGDMKDQYFKSVEKAYMRLLNEDTKKELIRFDLTEIAPDTTGVIVGELQREGMKWIFKATGQALSGGLARIASGYGLVIADQ